MALEPTANGGEPDGTVLRRLVFADVAHQYSVQPAPGAPLLVVELDSEEGDSRRAMEFVRPADMLARSVHVVGSNGSEGTGEPLAAPMASWRSTGFTDEFTDHVVTLLGASHSPADLASLGPLMLLRTHLADTPYTEVLMCARVRTLGVLFTRVGRFGHHGPLGGGELVARALDIARTLEDHVRIEGNAYLNFELGTEIEQKITLLDDVSVWAVTKDLWTAVQHGSFPGFITDPGYELTRWHFVQHNFEVLGPAHEIGHMAFQEQPDGRYQLKRKRFAEDRLRREESFRKGIEVPGKDFAGFLAEEYPALEFRCLPSFTRTRFDINVQSVVTGHYFGIETDEVTVGSGTGARKLRQIEIEYLETRWHEGMDAASIDTDLELLTGLVETQTARVGIRTRRDYYSKLSFLKDCLEPATA